MLTVLCRTSLTSINLHKSPSSSHAPSALTVPVPAIYSILLWSSHTSRVDDQTAWCIRHHHQGRIQRCWFTESILLPVLTLFYLNWHYLSQTHLSLFTCRKWRCKWRSLLFTPHIEHHFQHIYVTGYAFYTNVGIGHRWCHFLCTVAFIFTDPSEHL